MGDSYATMRRSKKGVMGIGMLIIFIATLLISATAAGVLITATNLLEQRALTVEQSVRERLVSGIDIVSVYVDGDVQAGTVDRFEFLIRTRAGSLPIQWRTLSLSFITDDLSLSANFNESISGDDCSFDNLLAEEYFCVEYLLGDGDTVLQEGELHMLRYRLNESNALSSEQLFDFIFQPKTGDYSILELRVPEIILRQKIRLR